jgi:hypothetical protein
MEAKLEKTLALVNALFKDVESCKLKIMNLELENFELKSENAELKKKIDNFEDNLKNVRRQIEKIESNQKPACNQRDAPSRVRLTLPKFRGAENESPMSYLKDLKNYFDLVQPELPEFKCIISQSLEGNARDWWHLVESEVHAFDDFVDRIKDRYWSRRIQRNFKMKIEYGWYDRKKNVSRVDYATNLFRIFQELELNFDEEEATTRIGGHFERDIRHAIIGMPSKNFSELTKILAEYDQDDRRESEQSNQYQDAGGHSRKDERPSSQEDAQQSQQMSAVVWVVGEDESSNEMETNAEEDSDVEEDNMSVESNSEEDDTFSDTEN